ncbi:hypothetical protein HHK36_023700 [Tetracentron sinense]|uniref:Protein kinase domain-containing protein n=1 Tax=Tetracentron sinense TaxID=13715 RepID=A0A835D635_TETSI|nr:hypothetical protein HHK36_023700 [Tetracentron sinense]
MLSFGGVSRKRSAMDYLDREIYARVFMGLIVIFILPISHGYTDPRDVTAMNGLYASLGYPPLPGWIPNGGDPCLEAWQGVQCVIANITGIIVNGANLGGELGDNLEGFTSIIVIDFSNNHIGGSIPSNLPLTMKNFFLSSNQFTGSIPSTLSSLTQLSAMSLNNNLLTGEIPDAFQALTGLINLDLSGNNLSGKLPPSLENLSSLTTLNIEYNLFSGPIPEKLLSIPNFKKDGNSFNTTIAPSSPPAPQPPPVSESPSSEERRPSTPAAPNSARTNKYLTTKKIIWIAIAGVLIFIVIALGLVLFMSRCCKGRPEADRIAKRHEMGEKTKYSGPFVQPNSQIEKVPKEAVVRPNDRQGIDVRKMGAIRKPGDKQEIDVKRMGGIPKQEDHGIDMPGVDMILMPPPPPPPVEKVIVKPIVPTEVTTGRPSTKSVSPPTSVRSFTVASLQQYTESFSQEYLVGGGMLGSVYRAELPDGKILAVKKLDNAASRRQKDEEFLELVSSISKLRHANVVELVGYCAEHRQHLLIYEYCSNGTLNDALHADGEFNKKLSWNARVRMALGAARALEYLHEVCQPPVVHRNFKSANVLLDDELSVRVSDCGLAPLISSASVSQLSGHLLSAYGYGAPEFESGTYTYRSDVYSFGVVMLELLTGRKSYDSSRPRGEQFLVRWAIPQLHDIDALSRMVDPSLNGAYPVKSLSRFADIISLCLQSPNLNSISQLEPEFRPPMSEIVQDLLHIIEREPPNKRLNKN